MESRRRAESLAGLTRLAAESFTIFPISAAQFQTAARFANQYAVGLRPGDVPHLAIAADPGATIGTLDRRLADSASMLGVSARLA